VHTGNPVRARVLAAPPVAAVTPAPATPEGALPRGGGAAKSDLPGLFASSPASTRPGLDPFTYFVQAGAYGRTEDAEQQRARLAMLGFSAKVTEREQSGRTVYRVRLGPFEHKDEADAAKTRLADSGVDAALVRVQK
jgi:cell division protein FtsN